MITAANVKTTSKPTLKFYLESFVLNANPYLNSLYKRPDMYPDIENAKKLLASGRGVYASGSIGEERSNNYLLVTKFFKHGSNECFETVDGSCYVIA